MIAHYLWKDGTKIKKSTMVGAGANVWKSNAPYFDKVGDYTYKCTTELTGGTVETTSSEMPLTVIGEPVIISD